MTIVSAQIGTTQVSWVEFKDENDRDNFYGQRETENQPAAAFVYHNYLNPKFPHGNEADDVLADDPRQIRIWAAVKKIIPSFGDYKNTDISPEFADRVFSSILPESPFKDAYRYKSTALRALAVVLLLIEMPLRHVVTLVFCRVMDVYSFKNHDFSEFYKCRATMYAGQPFKAIIDILC